MDKTLYEEIGGKDAVDQAVIVFYEKVLSDDRIKHFFDGVNMKLQIAKQKSFLTFVFGGPSKYSGKNMRDGHAHLIERGLNESHFDAVMENLATTLQELNIPENLIAQAAAIAMSVKDDVLNR
jgi:hemoglobin